MAHGLANEGGGMSVRAPKDEDEARRARLMLALGQGRTIANVIEEITGSAPEKDLVDTVKARLRAAAEDGEPFDLSAFLEAHATWQEAWA